MAACSWPRFRWTPHTAIVAIKDNKDCIRVVLFSYYTTIAEWGILLIKLQLIPCVLRSQAILDI